MLELSNLLFSTKIAYTSIMNNHPQIKNKPIKAILLLFAVVFTAEMAIMNLIHSVISNKVPAWGLAVLDAFTISIVSLIAIYFMNAKSLINLKKDSRTELLILKVSGIIFSIEAVIMFILSLPEITFTWWEDIITDSMTLSVFTVGLIYLVVIRPNLPNKNKDGKEGKDIVKETLAANMLVFISFAVLIAIICYIVYTKNPEQDDILFTLSTLYTLFIIVSGFIVFVLNRFTHETIKNTEHIHKMAHLDPLTNLGNRRYFETIINNELQVAEQNNERIALMFLDLDKFKEINDTYGHNVGDSSLKETAQRIMQCLRKDDIACRLGGDEFAIVLPKIKSADEAENIAKRILELFNQQSTIGDLKLKIGISIGITLSQHTDTQLSLVQRADRAMYQSKSTDINKYTIL